MFRPLIVLLLTAQTSVDNGFALACTTCGISVKCEQCDRMLRHADQDDGPNGMYITFDPARVEMQRAVQEAQNVRQAIPSCQVMLTSGEYMGYGRWRNHPPLMWSRHTTIHPRRWQESTRIMTMLSWSSKVTMQAYIKSTADRLCGTT